MAPGLDESWRAAYFYGAEQIRRYLADPKVYEIPRPVHLPDGMPIGSGDDWDGGWN
jgi:hypothetical protein